MRAASELVSFSMEPVAFASRRFAPKIVDLSVRLIHSRFVPIFLVSERSRRRKPPAKRIALYIYMSRVYWHSVILVVGYAFLSRAKKDVSGKNRHRRVDNSTYKRISRTSLCMLGTR